jgi:dethiobiotin synthetase
MNKGLFVTATSTDVGKTVLSSLICKKLATAGKKVAYYKPVQTGSIKDKDGNLISTDCLFVQGAIKEFPECKTFSTYNFIKPASPHYSAQLENKTIELKKIKQKYNQLEKDFDYIIVEGAGGIYVPLNENKELIADIPQILNLNTIIVSYAGLGAINHVSLTVEYAKSKNISIACIILISREEKLTDIELDNLNIIKKLHHIENVFILSGFNNVDTDNTVLGNVIDDFDIFGDVKSITSWIK